MKIGNNLRRQRLLAGLSQQELASMLGIPYTSISAYENNRRGAHPGRIKALANAIGCTVADLIGEI